MKLQVLLLLICMLYTKALALKCNQCISESSLKCTDTQVSCTDMCGSSTISVYAGEIKISEVNGKNCSKAQECITGSINFGLAKVSVNTKCCNTELCNSQQVPALPIGSPNGKTCFFCGEKDCSGTVKCEGDEDRCFKATSVVGGVKAVVKGCVSKSICTAASFKQSGIPGDLNCCEGNQCNNANSFNLSFLFLLLPLLSSSLLY